MTLLWWAFAALSAIALLFVCYPLLTRRNRGADNDTLDANVQLYQEHLADLGQQQRRGEITEQQLAELSLELQRGLLGDSDSGPSKKHSVSSPLLSRALLGVLLVAVPLAALLAYQQLGASRDLAIIELLEESSQLRASDAAQAGELRRDVLQRIEQRLQQQPDNFYYWVLSGRLNVERQQFDRAVRAYRRADRLSGGDDVTLLQEYLQAAFSASERGNRGDDNHGEMKTLADRILALTPGNLTVLGLRGRLAMVEGDYRRAVADWSKVLQALPPQHQTTKQLAGQLQQARQQLSEDDLAAMARGRIQLRLEAGSALAGAIENASGNALLFVIARPQGVERGSPLAVKRLPFTGLPLEVTLDDSNVMLPGATLADAQLVSVVARISQSGAVQARPGDMQGALAGVAVGGDGAVELVIDKRL